MDRIQEFNEIIEKLKGENNESPILRNRKLTKLPKEEKQEEIIFKFSKSFLNECTLTVTNFDLVILLNLTLSLSFFRILHF